MLRRCCVPLLLTSMFTSLFASGLRADEDEPKWTEVTITPRAVSERPLDVELFPNEADRVPGNAVPILLRMRWEQVPELMGKLNKAAEHLNLPADEFSPAKLREEVPLVRFGEMQRAAYRTTADWEYPLRETDQLHMVLLPDAQEMRTFQRMLAAHARADVADGRVEAAIEKIRVGLAVGDHVGRTPFLVIKLVQAVTQEGFLDRIGELQSRPEAPNLYWGLARLPRPLVDLTDTADWERRFVPSFLPELTDLEKPRTREEWKAVGERIVKLLQEFDNDWRKRLEELGGERKALGDYLARARKRLPELRPEWAERIGEMSDEEVGVRYFAVRVLVENDHATSVLLLSPPEAVKMLPSLAARQQDWEDEPELRMLIGNFRSAAFRIWSVDRRIAALRTVAALRDHAAHHDGKLPATLDDTALPVPADPFTNRPFEYTLKDGVAELVAPPLDLDGSPRFGVRLRIRVR